MRIRCAVYASLALCCVVSLATGCGAMVTSATISTARANVETAHRVRAYELAPYEFTAAAEYLDKALELQGRARFREAEEFARQADGYAKSAIRRSQEADEDAFRGSP